MAKTAKNDLALLLLIFIFQLLYISTEAGLIGTSGNSNLAKYNESCEADMHCDTSLQLKCINGICNCTEAGSMIFRNQTGMCHLKWGQKCSQTENSFKPSPLKLPSCVPNSRCSPEGHCQCNNGTFETAYGVCHPKLQYLQRCKSNSQCQEDKHLFCNPIMGFNVCDCDINDSMTYSYKENRCVLMVGIRPPAHISEFSCIMNSFYNYFTGKCQCNSGFSEKYGFCIVPFGGICDIDQPCEPDMICWNGRCECLYSRKDRINGTCYSGPGERCLLEKRHLSLPYWRDPNFQNISLLCVANAVCSPVVRRDNFRWNEHQCFCQSGYVDIKGKCEIDSGRGLVGESCSRTNTNDTAPSCTPGAFCAIHKRKYVRMHAQNTGISAKHEGRCKCDSEYKVNSDRTCTKKESDDKPETSEKL